MAKSELSPDLPEAKEGKPTLTGLAADTTIPMVTETWSPVRSQASGDHRQVEQKPGMPEPRTQEAAALAQAGAHTHLFEVVQAMLVTVGDVQGVQVLQRTPVIWEAHSGDPLQDLVQFLLAGGLQEGTLGVRIMGPQNTGPRCSFRKQHIRGKELSKATRTIVSAHPNCEIPFHAHLQPDLTPLTLAGGGRSFLGSSRPRWCFPPLPICRCCSVTFSRKTASSFMPDLVGFLPAVLPPPSMFRVPST